MIRRLILFFGVLALALAPTMVCAQYSGAFGLSGLPSMPSFFGGSGKCGEAAGCCGAPAVYFGWGIPQDRNTSVTLTGKNNGVGFGVPLLRGNVPLVDIKLPTGGFWLGAALPICLTDCLSFVGTGWYLFPTQATANNDDDWTLTVLRIHLQGDIGTDWRTQYNWWFVDGAFAYTFGGSRCGSCGCFSLLLGLRYDYYTASIGDPTGNSMYYLSSILFNSEDAGDVISRCWIPFVGLQTAYTDSVQSLKLRILGIPTNVGSSYVGLTLNGPFRFEYDNVKYSGGGFLEIFGEYTRKFFGPSQAGVFARWNLATATSSGTSQYHSANGVLNAFAIGDTYDFRLDRNTWTLGGLVTLDFNTPL